MRYFQRITAFLAIATLALPSVAFADVAVKSCCILLTESTVNSCFQFTDVLPGSPSEDEKNVMRNFQQYKCLNVPQHYVNYQGQTANWIVNDANNSGVCGTATTRSATCATANSTPLTAHARCETEADCGAGTAYVCEENFCKLKEGQLCSGDSGTQVNCANGLACRPADGGKKCLSEISSSSGASESVDSGEAPFTPIIPVLGVEIPGFSFTPATEENGIISVPYLGQYVNALYRYLTAIVLTVAIVMVVYGGFQYLLAATPLGVKNGKKTITDALIGMGLVLGAYVILNTVNPSLLSLRALEFERIEPIEVQLSVQFGGMAEDGGEAPQGTGSLSSVAAASPGTWRANALAVCGDSDVSQLSLDARKSRLKTIVTTWTDLATTQKGSIYVRGGQLACSAAPKEYSYKASTLSRMKSSGYSVNVSSECLANPPANSVSSSDACAASLVSEYNRLVSVPGNSNGLICGDCGTYQRSLMRCFGGNTYAEPLRAAMFPGSDGACANYRPGPDDVGYLRITDLNARRSLAHYDEAEVTAFINRLQFGDMLMWSSNSRTRHVFMYTGKAGLPYEIVEMGGGGQGDVIGGSNGRSFWAKVGLPNFDGSHVKAHRSAYDYIMSSPRSGAKCMKGVRVIDN